MTSFSYSSGDPDNLTGGGGADMSDISGPFADIETFLNGNIDTTNLATSAKPVTLLGQYRTVSEAQSFVTAGATSAAYMFRWGSGVQPSASSAATAAAMYFDPSDFAVSGLTTKMRVRGVVTTNGTAPAITFTFGLYPVAASGGASSIIHTLGTVVSGSTAAVATPAINSVTAAVSSDFNVPSAGGYALGIALSGTTAASSACFVMARLEVHHV